jgi:hypothetical protein
MDWPEENPVRLVRTTRVKKAENNLGWKHMKFLPGQWVIFIDLSERETL